MISHTSEVLGGEGLSNLFPGVPEIVILGCCSGIVVLWFYGCTVFCIVMYFRYVLFIGVFVFVFCVPGAVAERLHNLKKHVGVFAGTKTETS